ncbi:MAG: helix-turn-helix transcriptional regulator [Verrucomicrobiota bacterium]
MENATGNALRRAREARGTSLEGVSAETRIAVEYLQGLEDGDYSALPAKAYTKSFLTLYGDHLGVNVEEALGELNHEPGKGEKPDFLQTDLKLDSSNSTIPIVKHKVVVKKAKQSPIGVILVILLALLVPTVFYVGKRVAHQEILEGRGGPGVSAGADVADSTGGPMLDPDSGFSSEAQSHPLRATAIKPVPLDPYSDEPYRDYEPDEEFNSILGMDPDAGL